MARAKGGERREVLVLAVCLGLSVLLFAFAGPRSETTLSRLTTVLLWPADQVRGFVEGVFSERRENERLRREILLLRTLQVRADAAEEETVEPPTPAFRQALERALVPGRVVGTAGEPWPILFHLAIGSRDGLAEGQMVVSAEGLVGRLVQVTPSTSAAALLTDPSLAVAAVVVPSGVRGVLRFRAEDAPGLYLHHVPLTDTVRVGEMVATSGMSLHFPPGVPVGRVSRVGRDPGGLVKTIEVRPLAPMNRLREVFVLVDSTAWERAAGLWGRTAPRASQGAASLRDGGSR